MSTAARPRNDVERLAALHRYGVLDTLPEQAYDDIATLAARICNTPIALISFVDEDRLWFKSSHGIKASETERDIAFCAHAIQLPDQVFVVGDTLEDARFRDNPLVTNAPSIRFYAGAPVVTADGYPLGTVCALDNQPRVLSEMQIDSLRTLSRLVSNLLEQGRGNLSKTSAEIDTNKRHFETLLALTMDGLDLKAFIDCDYHFRYLNQTYLDYWDKRPEQAEGKSVVSVMGKETFAAVRPLMARAMLGESISYVRRFDYPTKGSRQMQISYLPARDAGGTIIGIVIRGHDLQDLKDSEDKLRATVSLLEDKNLAQQRFIQVISHDLREPVNAIINFSSLLDNDHAASMPDQARQYLGYIEGGGQRMRELLDDLVNYVRIDETNLELQAVDFDQLMTSVVDDLAGTIAAKQAKIEWLELPQLQGERSLIRVLMQNLVSNAIKFSRRGIPPMVRISAVVNGAFWEIRVEDNGIGIPTAKREKVFDMFQRLHSRKQFAGTGLGLATCRKIAELHGGRIWVSTATGAGCCMHVLLARNNGDNPV